MIVGATRVRNEDDIIGEALTHAAQFCDAGIYVWDDASTDRTPYICATHPAVKHVHQVDTRGHVRLLRDQVEQLCRMAMEQSGADWIYYFDADEFADLNVDITQPVVSAFSLRFSDFYMTDPAQTWRDVTMIGPEYRDIVCFWHRSAWSGSIIGDRTPHLHEGVRVWSAGACRHYGKARGVERWDAKCDDYVQRWPEPIRSRWAARKGKAVHTTSSFGLPLYPWDERWRVGVKLTPEIQDREREVYG